MPLHAAWAMSLAVAELVQKIDDGVILLHAHSVEVLSHHRSQLMLVLSRSLVFVDHGWGVEADATRLREDPAMVGAGRRRGGS